MKVGPYRFSHSTEGLVRNQLVINRMISMKSLFMQRCSSSVVSDKAVNELSCHLNNYVVATSR